jgi:hypothetical protein
MVVHDLVDNVPDVDIGNARTVERMILLALTQAISEQGDMDAVRLDVVRHGRYGQAGCRRTRDAVGWLSRSVPHVLEIPGDEFETERCAAQLDEIKEAEPYWDEAREYLRNQSPAEDSFMGNIHAYVNFHGTLDPVGRSVGEFSYMKHQPAISYPSRSRACTPMRVLVRRSGSGLNFSWRYTGMFHDLDIPRGIISRTGELFRNSLGSAGGPRRPVQAVKP